MVTNYHLPVCRTYKEVRKNVLYISTVHDLIPYMPIRSTYKVANTLNVVSTLCLFVLKIISMSKVYDPIYV